MENKKEDLIILYSGGADSRLLIEFTKLTNKTPICLLIDYGQKHIEELNIATEFLIKKSICYRTFKIENFQIHSGLTGNGIKGTYKGVHERHVPGRNSIFLSLAFSLAESKGIDTIWIGSDWSDRLNLFPDCYQEYIVKINEVFKIAGSMSIKVEAPLMGLSKENILNMLSSMGIPQSDIYSGYGDH